MRVTLKSALSDSNINANQSSSQRQLMLSIAATSEQINTNLPINLCLVLDHSGSMQGKPLETVKKAALNLVGWEVGGLRSPLCSLSTELEEGLAKIMQELALI